MKRRILWQAVASIVVVCVSSTSTVLLAQPPASEDLSSEPIEVASELEPIEVDRDLSERLEESDELGEEALPPPDEVIPTALPGGAEAKSAATPQAISLPSAEGSIEGMGESFSPVLSSGTGTFSIPIALPAGRAGVQPSLALSYSTAGGNGPVGLGWSIGAPFIARQTDRGLPRYIDAAGYHAEEDRFIYNGGQELVPVDSAAMAAIDRVNPSGSPFFTGTVYPSGVDSTWQEYRARVEGGFMRFFRAPDSRRWIVVSKDGTRFDFGALASTEGPSGIETTSARALHTEADDGTGAIYAWQLTRMSDAHGSTVYYTYTADRGQRYLFEIHYLSPATCAAGTPAAQRNCSRPFSEYGVRVRFDYETRPDPFTTFVPGFRCETALRLNRITVTAAESAVGTRNLVRRYHLAYAPATTSFHSLLTEVTVEGRPDALHAASQVYVASDVAESALTAAIVGRTLPPMRFSYTASPSGPVSGFGGIASTVTPVVGSPEFSADNARADLFDVNSDGLTDFIVTEPGRFRTADDRPAVGVYFNGFAGSSATPASAATFSSAIAVPMESGLSGTLDLSNSNIQPMDIDGDGRSDLLHMPRRTSYGFFSPTRTLESAASVLPTEQGWEFSYAEVNLDAAVDPRIDFGADSPFIRAFDVNDDHLVDIVRTTGTSLQTWLNLGWIPGGNGKFGSATYAAGTGYTLSTTPIETCLPRAGLPLDFASSEIRLADMNGDGLQDIVKVRRGDVLYWPGRGDGVFGVGSRECPAGYAGGREIRMADSPRDLPFSINDLHVADVNGDGASDLVQIRFDAIDVWFNKNGTGFTPRVITPVSARAPGFRDNVRFADIDGSGTLDVVYAHATRWEYVDLMGGAQPRLLSQVENGLGAITSLEYGSSAEDYLDDLAAAQSCTTDGCDRFTWSIVDDDFGCDSRFVSGPTDDSCYLPGTSPVISNVVRAMQTSDQFDLLGREENVVRTEYRYHNGYYDGIEQEFRGFGAADAIAIGDAVHPTATTRTHFHQGRRPSGLANDRTVDNPFEALKGRAFLTESFDAAGRYLSTVHSSYTLRWLYEGLDTRMVQYAFVHATDELRYDTTAFVAANVPFDIAVALRVGLVGTTPFELPSTIWRRGTTYAHLRGTVDVVDNAGNMHQQSAWGRIRGENGETPAERIVSRAVPVLVNPSEWIWRTARTFVNGDGTSVDLGDTSFTYSSQGDLLLSTTVAGIPAANDFSGDTGMSPAEGYTQTSSSIEGSSTYDSWGNSVESCGGADIAGGAAGCLRYGNITYDTAYRSLPITEAIAVEVASSPDPPGYTIVNGFRALATQATWHRGYGLLLTATDPNSQTTTVRYDGLGRLTAIYAPDNATIPAHRFTYDLVPGGAPVSVVHAYRGTNGGSISVSVKTRAYVDGLGRTRAALADDTTNWEQSGVAQFTARGTARRVWQPVFVTGTTPSLSSAVAIPSAATHTGSLGCPTDSLYDAWGRVVAVTECAGDPLAATTATSYRPLSTEVYDPFDLVSGPPAHPFFNTPSIARMDGHGRVIEQILQNKRFDGTTWGDVEFYRLKSTYRPDGAVTAIERAQVDSALFGAGYVSSRHVERTFSYDTIGRRIAATDPDTDNAGAAAGARTWRYLFNEVGDLAAVRDPRGCGQNFYYDRAGRLVAEDYVRCDEAQLQGELPDDDVPPGTIGLTSLAAARMVDVRHHFDVDPPWTTDITGTTPAPSPARPATTFLLGRLTATSDRGARTLLAYDARGRTAWTGRQVAMIPSDSYATTTLADPPAVVTDDEIDDDASRLYDTSVTYVTVPQYDHGDRPEYLTFPRDPDYSGTGSAPVIKGRLYYDGRSLPRRADLIVDSTTYPLLTPISYSRDRLVTNIQYDHQKPGMVDSSLVFTYDARRRVLRESLARTGDTSLPADDLNRVGGFVFFRQHVWDAASNLVELRDDVSPAEFPAGYKPSRTRIDYDALYRVARARIDYKQVAGGAWTTDTALDWRASQNAHRPADPMREAPAPMLPAMPANRVAQLNYDYDWLANMTSFTDNASNFYERSIGTITNGGVTPGRRPSALYLAANLPTTAPSYNAGVDRGGYVEVDYGVSGNAVAMTVHARCFDESPTSTCHDGGNSDLASRRADLRAACLCVEEQHYQYRYDELNRISEARRFDRDGTGDWTLAVRQRYRYDAGNQRIIKQTLDDDFEERSHLYIYPGDFDRSGMIRNGAGTEYLADLTFGSETQYLVAGARVVWKDAAPSPTALSNEVRVLHSVGDIIGTTAAVIDAYSGELVETRNYYPNGAQESLRAQDVPIQPEPNGFTTKEADDEVGITYFGQRYLFQHLGRWTTPDPLHVHAVGGGEALNSYHYVAGNLLQARDPLGLDCEGACEGGEEGKFTLSEGGAPVGAGEADDAGGEMHFTFAGLTFDLPGATPSPEGSATGSTDQGVDSWYPVSGDGPSLLAQAERALLLQLPVFADATAGQVTGNPYASGVTLDLFGWQPFSTAGWEAQETEAHAMLGVALGSVALFADGVADFAVSLGRRGASLGLGEFSRLLSIGDELPNGMVPPRDAVLTGTGSSTRTFRASGGGTDLVRTTVEGGTRIQIHSGHGFNRAHRTGDLRSTGLTMDRIENAIIDDLMRFRNGGGGVPRVGAGFVSPLERRIRVGGVDVAYRAVETPRGLSVGTYFPP
jgi:RHS repeat-associated protein